MEQIDRIVFTHPELEAAELLFEAGRLNVFFPLLVEFLVVLKNPWLSTSGVKRLMSLVCLPHSLSLSLSLSLPLPPFPLPSLTLPLSFGIVMEEKELLF